MHGGGGGHGGGGPSAGGHHAGHPGSEGGPGGVGLGLLTSKQAIRDARAAPGYRPSLFERLKLALQRRRHRR
jgi:hypothetical protein